MHDLVEWVAEQPWCDGNVGMVGISYFAMTQLEAAVERPPHLRAIFPVAVTPDVYAATYHHGLFSASFISPFVTMVGITSAHGDALWRGRLLDAARRVLAVPRLHERFATINGEAAVGGLKLAMRAHYDPHPWDDIWRQVAVEHQVRDEYWDERTVLAGLADVDIPVYLGATGRTRTCTCRAPPPRSRRCRPAPTCGCQLRRLARSDQPTASILEQAQAIATDAAERLDTELVSRPWLRTEVDRDRRDSRGRQLVR